MVLFRSDSELGAPLMSDGELPFEDLLTHGTWLERLAHRLVHHPDLAEDAVQSTWLNALRRPPADRDRGRAWLRRVLEREVSLARRKRERRTRHEMLSRPPGEEGPDATEPAELAELRADLVRALGTIPEPYRSTLRLHFFEERSTSDIASALGVSAATVRWRVMTGLERMRAELRRRHPDRPLHLLLLPLTSRSGGDAGPLPPDASPVRPSPRRRLVSGSLVGLAGILLLGGGILLRARSMPRDARAPDVVDAFARTRPVSATEPPALAGDRRAENPGGTSAAPDASSQVGGPAVPPIVLPVEVVDSTDAPRSGARVLVLRREDGRFDEEAVTDARGTAIVRVAAADLGAWGSKGSSGRLAIRARAPGWACSDVTFASPRPARTPVRLRLPAHETVFEGEVVDEDGRPVFGADVEIGYAQANQLSGVVDRDPSMPQPECAKSDERGRFRVDGVDATAGRVRVHAWRKGFVPAFHEQLVDGTTERSCKILLPHGAAVRGMIRRADGRPAVGARVWNEPCEQGGDGAVRSAGYVARLRGWGQTATTGDDGRFELTGLPRNVVLLWADDPLEPGNVASDLVTITEREPAEWDAQLAPRAPLEIVLEGSAAHSPGWTVRLWFAGPHWMRCIREEVTDVAGAVHFLDVLGAEFDVSVFAPDTGFLAARTRLIGPHDLPAHLTVDPPALVEGRVLDAGGRPFTDGFLGLAPTEGLAPWTQLPFRGEDGSFEHGMPAGNYDLIASRHGSYLRLATFALGTGSRADLGEIRCPALGKLRIEIRGFASSDGLGYRLFQRGPKLPAGVNPRVEVGSWPPPQERELLPGRYDLDAGDFLGDEVRVDRSWPVEIEAGRTTTVVVAP